MTCWLENPSLKRIAKMARHHYPGLLRTAAALIIVMIAAFTCGSCVDNEKRTTAGLIRLFERDDFLKGCSDNLKLIPSEKRKALTRFVEDRLGITLANEGLTVFPCIMAANSRSNSTLRTVALQSPTRQSAKVTLPDNAVLDYHFGLPPNTGKPFLSFLLTVRVTGNNGKLLREKAEEIHGLQQDLWYHRRVDLKDLGNQEVTIELSLNSDPTDNRYLLIGEPLILSVSDDRQQQALPNIIIVCLDTLRGDHLGCTGYQRKTTPTLDRIAAEGTLFKQAFAQAGYTLPSHKSFLSGLYPQLFDYYSDSSDPKYKRLTDEISMLQDHLGQIGYHNVAFTGGGYIGAVFGFYRGFDLYNEIGDQKKQSDAEPKRIIQDSGFNPMLKWLKANRNNNPFFLFFHTYGIHAPYAPPEKYDKLFKIQGETKLNPTISNVFIENYNQEGYRENPLSKSDIEHVRSVYDRGIRWIDDEMARFYNLLDEQGLLENTILIILSDHGEEFCEHQKLGHNKLYEQDLHVPLIIRYPHLCSPGTVVEDKVELVDIVPTLLDILKARPDQPLHGKSLVALLKTDGKSAARGPERPIFASHHNWKTIRLGDSKYHYMYHEQETEFIFDLRKDQLEQKNLLENRRSVPELASFRNRLLYYVAQNIKGWNLLILPKHRERYKVNIEGLKKGQDLLDRGRKYSFAGKDIGIFINQSRVRFAGKAALICFEGELEESMTIEITKSALDGEDTEEVPVTVMFGLSEGIARVSPISIVQNTMNQSYPSIDRGIDSRLFDDYEVFLWWNNLRVGKMLGTDTNEIPQEAVEALKNLGYLH